MGVRGKRNNGREIKIKKRTRAVTVATWAGGSPYIKLRLASDHLVDTRPIPRSHQKFEGQQLKEWIDLGFLVNPVQGSDSIRMGNHDGFGACPTYRVPVYSTARGDWIDFSSFPFCRALVSLRSWLVPMVSMLVTVSKAIAHGGRI
jgi:hypothetical protein